MNKPEGETSKEKTMERKQDDRLVQLLLGLPLDMPMKVPGVPPEPPVGASGAIAFEVLEHVRSKKKRDARWLQELEQGTSVETLWCLSVGNERYLFVQTSEEDFYSLGEIQEGRKYLANRLRSDIGEGNHVFDDDIRYFMLLGAYSRLDPGWFLKYTKGVHYVLKVYQNHNEDVRDKTVNLGVYLGHLVDVRTKQEQDVLKQMRQDREYTPVDLLFSEWLSTRPDLPDAKAIFFINASAYWGRRLAANKSENTMTVIQKVAREIAQDHKNAARRRYAHIEQPFDLHHPVSFKWIVLTFCKKHNIDSEKFLVAYRREFEVFHAQIVSKAYYRPMTHENHILYHKRQRELFCRLGRVATEADYLDADEFLCSGVNTLCPGDVWCTEITDEKLVLWDNFRGKRR